MALSLVWLQIQLGKIHSGVMHLLAIQHRTIENLASETCVAESVV